MPLEDLGVLPDEPHHMTKRDLIEGNADLIAHAAQILKGKKSYPLYVEVKPAAGRALNVKIQTKNIDRVDIYVDGRPFKWIQVSDGFTRRKVQLPRGARQLEVSGYDKDKLVALRLHRLR